MDYSPPGSSIHGISQERLLDWDAISPPEDPPHPGVEPVSLALAGRFFTTEPPGEPWCHQNPEFWATVLSWLCCVNKILFSSVCLLWQGSWNYNENFKDWIFFNMVYWVMFALKGTKLSTLMVFFVCWSFWAKNTQDSKVQEETLTFPTNYLRVLKEVLLRKGAVTVRNCNMNHMCREGGTYQSLLVKIPVSCCLC